VKLTITINLENGKAMQRNGGKETANILRTLATILDTRIYKGMESCSGAIVASDQVSVGSWKVKG
jgi:hypothetical protein